MFASKSCFLLSLFAIILLASGENQSCQYSKTSIIDKVLLLIPDETKFLQIIHFLTRQEEIYGSYLQSPSWTTLCSVYDANSVFVNFAHLLVKDNFDLNEHVDKLYESFYHQHLLEDRLKFSDILAGSADSIEKILQRLSPTVKAKILKKIPYIGQLQTAGTTMSLFSELLSSVRLPWEAIRNIYRWWNREISGKRAAKNVVDSLAVVGGGAFGASAGATIGSFFGPVGTVIGGAIGGISGSITAAHFSEEFTEWFFDLPKTEALENAYNFLGVHHTESNAEINRAFRSLSMIYHPDRRSGSEERFMELQIYMAIIKAARGQL
uniref:J domain-containing protein n=1 Tax=Panagrolaimus davidi TaxID=227884 RepID=A0A914PNV7_9BILA